MSSHRDAQDGEGRLVPIDLTDYIEKPEPPPVDDRVRHVLLGGALLPSGTMHEPSAWLRAQPRDPYEPERRLTPIGEPWVTYGVPPFDENALPFACDRCGVAARLVSDVDPRSCTFGYLARYKPTSEASARLLRVVLCSWCREREFGEVSA